MAKKRLVLVGNGMAGVKTIEEILKIHKDCFEITVIGEEPYPNYNRILLSKVLQGDTTVKDITLNDWNWYKENNIRLFVNEKVIQVDPNAKVITTHIGTAISYDELIIATGSKPFILPIPGKDKEGVTTFRDIKDTETMVKASKNYRKAAVIGGGLLGLEAARGLLNLGMEVTVVHLGSSLMDRQLDVTAATLLKEELEVQGMRFLLEKNTTEIIGHERVECIRFSDGDFLECDLVVMAVGINPNVELANQAGLTINRGIIVNDYLQTNIPNIYAVGECAEHKGIAYGLVAPLFEQAKVLASAVCGSLASPYQGSVVSTQLKVSGVEVFSAGDFIEGGEKKALRIYDEQDGLYKKMVFKGKKIVGAVLFGDSREGTRLFSLIKKNTDVSDTVKVSLLQPLGGEAGESVVASMESDEIICGCNGVSKGSIVQAIHEQGCATVDAIKSCTSASRSCGGCKSSISELLEITLGEDFDPASHKETLCGCTDHSRDEVIEAIRTKHLMHTREVMHVLEWKTSDGCSKCRPALNYYLGMIHPTEYEDENESRYVNERLHANIQKDGSFGVVPRMYGGVTSSAQLRKIADVADKYNAKLLKVTGGQRIDIFGIEKEDLPKVWEELDMPSGYAYGKTLRTVKTCVGETFCRFGTQDSLSLGIALEKRLERVGSPHKFKMAVSACPRNCAESGIKDFGVVGVEGGFEMYVGGNGGTHLRAADLLGKVKTAEEVIDYASAYFQYYRETGVYLERTSKWLERMGLENIKIVIENPEQRKELNERLNLAVTVQEDPWKKIINNDKLKNELFESVTIQH
ncbi:nitrite reductase large subunit NirB [Ureibacillus sinduriensis]|uniref:Nitrite reductase n=1 Tax=Ureibacillus sinduriensis BLB-1 = JCM 15800 TaxID=1384057 RepID=A0A0A3I1S3_9BACL|nr:nitrite reductase large subunit NirB [Ureibacillus sinduriensis]KGR77440.1 nitrite reductase [Ureibacillus sinduriensis BLB-1 = JCM 15800]